MAKFLLELPDDEIKQFQTLGVNTDKMIEEMTQAGAKVVMENVKAKMPRKLFEALGEDNIILSRTYKTPSDGAYNTQVMITGYFTNRHGVKTPAPLVANMFEFGSSKKEHYPRQRFFRISFKKKPIEDAMQKVQDKYIKGGS